jgi:hypothetical protein
VNVRQERRKKETREGSIA